jgi:hypothetical protein
MQVIAPLSFEPGEMRCVSLLVRHNVEFLIVGGYAVRYHGEMRVAKDVDVLVGNDQRNSERLCVALTDILGVAHPNITPQAFVGRKRQVNFEEWGLKFEILSAANGVDFQQAYAERSRAVLGLIEVPIIGRAQLIAMKKAAGRPNDLADVAALERL